MRKADKKQYHLWWTKLLSEVVWIIPATLFLTDIYHSGAIFKLEPRWTAFTTFNLVLTVSMYYITSNKRFIDFVNRRWSK